MIRSTATIWIFLVGGHLLHAAESDSPLHIVTLLVHGLRVTEEQPLAVWGRAVAATDGTHGWDGLIGHLQSAGHRYGGTIRSQGGQIKLPACLDAHDVAGDPQSARLFSLEFSNGANIDGLAYKALELAQCLDEIRRFTGCRKVNLVAHSAGGLIARAYLQNALPGRSYAGEVDRLITIASPHQGSALAQHLGDLLGTRASSLSPTSPLIRQLNDELPLPADVRFASIVVRGVAIGISGLEWPADAYEPYVNRELLAALPVDFRLGGDQVVQVVSQNLRLSRCAGQYEALTGKPVLDLLARVPDPSPQDRSPLEPTAHEAAPGNRLVARYLEMLLADAAPLWSETAEPQAACWRDLQAWQCAFGVVEAESAGKHRFSVVQDVRMTAVERLRGDGPAGEYRFTGAAQWPTRFLGLGAKSTEVSGTLHLTFDRFGRFAGVEKRIERVVDR